MSSADFTGAADESEVTDCDPESDRYMSSESDQEGQESSTPKRPRQVQRLASLTMTPASVHTRVRVQRKRPATPDEASARSAAYHTTQRHRPTGASKIADALDSLATRSAPTVHERAIHVLTRCYTGIITDDEMVQAYELMTNKAKAAVFVAMPEGNCRDKWLKSQIFNSTSFL